jgi:flagellar hook assembly protein FlgD
VRAGKARVRVFDVTGRIVQTLLERNLEAGPNVVNWDGQDATGINATPGVYFYEVEVDREVVAKGQLVLL